MTPKDKKKAILRAIESIQEGGREFCCLALDREDNNLRQKFESIFRPPWKCDFWTFFSLPDESDESPLPSKEDRKSIRLTALWFFYHMQ